MINTYMYFFFNFLVDIYNLYFFTIHLHANENKEIILIVTYNSLKKIIHGMFLILMYHVNITNLLLMNLKNNKIFYVYEI